MELSITKISSDPEFVTRRIRAAVSVYLLDHFVDDKKMVFLEDMYGGKERSHEAATIIQRCFRSYRLRKSIAAISPKFSENMDVNPDGNNQKQSSETSLGLSREDYSNKVLINSNLNIFNPEDPFTIKDDDERRRLFYLGINLFNRNSNKGISFLIKHNIIDANENSIVKFFDTKGLSSYCKGEYMSQDNDILASATRREFISQLSFHNCSIEKGVRKLFSYIRVPGETQKILNMIEDFSSVYLNHNIEFRKKLKNPDTVVMIAFAILMLHTSLFNPSAKKQDKMSKEDFVNIFRDYTKDPAIEENYFDELFENIKRQQIKPLSDHTDLVRNIYNHLNGPKIPKTLIQNYRKLICHYQLNEIPNLVKKPNSHIHNRDAFLFNDLILITKKSQNSYYTVRHEIPLSGICISEFQTKYYPCSIEIRTIGGRNAIVYLDCIDEKSRKKVIDDVRMCVEELKQIEELYLL